MASSELPAWERWCTSQLNIVLLGGRNSGKSSVGNLILGKEEFVTRERTSCSRRVALVAGRCLTVVDTPGWWCDFSAQDTCELVKREIVTSVSLCSPGPHVFLIAVKASSAFSEKRRRALEEHVALLGEGLWGHCLVVYTSNHKGPKHRGVDGKALGWLEERCGQRCHTVVLGEVSGGAELLEKIQQLVAGNGFRVFEVEEKVLQEAVEEKRRVEERAQQRFLTVKTRRTLMRERLRPVTNIQIVLVGAKGSGKTSTMNTILCREHSRPLRRTVRCQVSARVVFGRQLTVVDTPGWWMNYFSNESCVFDRREMLLGLSLCPPGPHVFLLVVRVDRAFTDTYGRAAQEHLQLFGTNIWGRVIVVFSFGDWLGDAASERCIESEGEPLRRLVERCGNRYHVLNNEAVGDGFQVRELIGKIEEMLAGCGRGGGHYETERGVMEQMEGRMREEEERAKERVRKKEERRQMAKLQQEKLGPLQDIRIVLVSGRKTGKSSCGNTILSQESFPTDTQTARCCEKQAAVSGRSVTVVDTPGCFPVTPDLLLPLTAVLLVVNVSAAFRDAHREALEKQLEAGGGRVWSRSLVLFSHGDWLGDTGVEQRIESEGAPLRRLLERCGNRYHILDNKRRGGGVSAQVEELLELIEETLVGERLDALQRGERVWGGVSSAGGPQPEVVTLRRKKVGRLRSRRHQLIDDLSISAAPTTGTSLGCWSEAPQTVALPAGRGAGQPRLTVVDGDLSSLASVLSGKQTLRWTLNLPVSWFSVDDLHLRLNSDGQVCLFSPRRQMSHLALPHPLPAEGDISANSLLHPALRERTLQRLGDSGGLQLLLDQWDHSNLQELEAFIDSYFEVVWERTVGSCQTAEAELEASGPCVDLEEARHEEVLSSIDRKLSKLELLEEIKGDLTELRTNLEQSWKAIQELREKVKEDNNDTHEH